MGMAGTTEDRLGTALAAAAAPGRHLAHNPTGLMHTALRHRSVAELVSSVVPFVHDALRVNDPLFVSLPPATVAALKAELGHDADRVRWSDSTRWNPHPMRRLRAIRELVEGAERHGIGRVRLVGEVPLPAIVPEMLAEWERFDALLNETLAGHPVTVVCSYDESALPAEVVERASCSHPFMGLEPADRSSSYLDPVAYLDRHRMPEVPVPPGAQSVSGEIGPGDARAFVRRALGGPPGALPPLPASVVEDMSTAVSEMVTNAWQEGARSVTVTCWRTAREIGARVDDDGPGLMDPLAGYRWPNPAVERGRGMWLARQLVDVLDFVATGSGTSVRVRVFDAACAQPAA